MKRTLTTIIAGAALAATLAPVAHAEFGIKADARVNVDGRGPGMRNEMRGDMKADFKSDMEFCDAVAKYSDDASAWLSRHDEKRDDRNDRREGWFGSWGDKKGDMKADAEARWDDRFAKLEAMADTDAERKQLADLKASFEAAVNDHYAAANASAEITAERREALDEAWDELESDIEAAIARAKKSCGDDVADATVRAQFASDMSAARAEYMKARNDIKVEFKGDIQDRNDDRAEARAEARGFWEDFKLRLKAIFGIK